MVSVSGLGVLSDSGTVQASSTQLVTVVCKDVLEHMQVSLAMEWHSD